MFAVLLTSDDFAAVLVRASQSLGSFLDVASILGVQPRQVYRWVAGVETPAEPYRKDLERRLRSG